ncbi:MAG: hypothetical protein JRG76_04390 [Deltaproteobacteria bacterium]|nr:hypothetical protein [Deltaproteobacteria bacterium]MBW2413729.1 hypothetical protein [Deltaproteobacteria bacterium]
MHEFYEYRRIRITPRSWGRVGPALHARGAGAIPQAGGTLFGVFVGQIGLGANEGVVLTAWPDRESLERASGLVVDGIDDVLESTAESFVATVRPVEPTPPTERGVWAHRFFEIRDEDWPEFLELSEGAWPRFEETNGVRVRGFWRSLQVEPPLARVLLLTWYPSLAVWERSRGHRPDTKTEPEVWQRFVRRAQLTQATIVCTTELLLP